jgi:hypothetical protein
MFSIFNDVDSRELWLILCRIMYPELDTIQVLVTVFLILNLNLNYLKFPKDSVAYDTIKIDSMLTCD